MGNKTACAAGAQTHNLCTSSEHFTDPDITGKLDIVIGDVLDIPSIIRVLKEYRSYQNIGVSCCSIGSCCSTQPDGGFQCQCGWHSKYFGGRQKY